MLNKKKQHFKISVLMAHKPAKSSKIIYSKFPENLNNETLALCILHYLNDGQQNFQNSSLEDDYSNMTIIPVLSNLIGNGYILKKSRGQYDSLGKIDSDYKIHKRGINFLEGKPNPFS